MAKTILITGTSRGFGKIWAETFLQRGDQVVATARDVGSLAELAARYGKSILCLQLDVTDRARCFEVVNKAHQHFGKLDVLINNAGYGLVGALEEASEQQARDQFETNVFGNLWMTQAAIPVMRNQGGGHIIQVTSVLGIVTVPLYSLYNATKWAVEGFTESMVTEVKDFGIHLSLVEPIAYATDFGGASGVTSKPMDVYTGLKQVVYEQFRTIPYGEPSATAEAIKNIVDMENPPFRVFFGKTALPWVQQVYADRLAQWEATQPLAEQAHGNLTQINRPE